MQLAMSSPQVELRLVRSPFLESCIPQRCPSSLDISQELQLPKMPVATMLTLLAATQFYLGPELSGGTACGVSALPNGKSTSGKQGGGPGYLYVCLPIHKQFKTSF